MVPVLIPKPLPLAVTLPAQAVEPIAPSKLTLLPIKKIIMPVAALAAPTFPLIHKTAAVAAMFVLMATLVAMGNVLMKIPIPTIATVAETAAVVIFVVVVIALILVETPTTAAVATLNASTGSLVATGNASPPAVVLAPAVFAVLQAPPAVTIMVTLFVPTLALT